MSATIRSALLTDVAAMLVFEQQAPGAAHWTAEQYNKLVGGGVVLVAEQVAGQDAEDAPAPCKERRERGTLCGFVCAQAVAGDWEIENVVVARGFLRRGLATEL